MRRLLRSLVVAAVLAGAASAASAACRDELRNGMLPSEVLAACGEPKYVFTFMDFVADASLRPVTPPFRPIRTLLPEPFHMARVKDAISDLTNAVQELQREVYELQVELSRARLAAMGVYAEVWDYPSEGCTVAIMGRSVATGLFARLYNCQDKPLADSHVEARARAYALLFPDREG